MKENFILRNNQTAPKTLTELEDWARNRYHKYDIARGIDKTFVLFIEEVGELATAIARRDNSNLREEVGDVLMWLMSLANLSDINVQECVNEYIARNSGTTPKE